MQENDRNPYLLVYPLDCYRKDGKMSCSSLLHLTSDEAEAVLDEIDGMDNPFFLIGPIRDDGPGLGPVHDFLDADHFDLISASSEKEDPNFQWFSQ
jgi:hypothetical protein